jgi:hypothetical protein
VGGVCCYGQVQEFDSIIGFQVRAKLDVAMDSFDVMQNIIWVGACGVVNREYIGYISGVKGQDPGVDKMFDNGFL